MGNFPPWRRTFNNDAVSHAAEAAGICASPMHRRRRLGALYLLRILRVVRDDVNIGLAVVLSLTAPPAAREKHALICEPNPRRSGNPLIILTFITPPGLKGFPMRSTRAGRNAEKPGV